MALSTMMAVASGGPYSDMPFHIPKGKPQRVIDVVRCCKCGHNWGTMYKHDDGYICKDCKAKEVTKDNEEVPQ